MNRILSKFQSFAAPAMAVTLEGDPPRVRDGAVRCGPALVTGGIPWRNTQALGQGNRRYGAIHETGKMERLALACANVKTWKVRVEIGEFTVTRDVPAGAELKIVNGEETVKPEPPNDGRRGFYGFVIDVSETLEEFASDGDQEYRSLLEVFEARFVIESASLAIVAETGKPGVFDMGGAMYGDAPTRALAPVVRAAMRHLRRRRDAASGPFVEDSLRGILAQNMPETDIPPEEDSRLRFCGIPLRSVPSGPDGPIDSYRLSIEAYDWWKENEW